MNWEVLLAVFIWEFTCVENCSECVLYGLVSHSVVRQLPLEWFSSLIVNRCGFFEYPTLCSDPFVGLLNGQTDGQLASSICDNAVVILKWP